LSICFLGSLESQASLRASRRAFIVVALLVSSPPATRAAGSAVRLRTKRTTLSWSTVAMADDEESFGSDDDLHSSSSEEEEAHGEVLLPRSGSLHRANGRCSSLNGAAPAADGCASSAAPRTDSEQPEVSPHAHRGAFRPPRRRGCSKDSRSHYKRDIKWVKEGAQEDLINQEFDGHSLHHPEVQSEWSTFIQSAASVSKEMQSAPAVAPAASGIPQRTKPSWDRGVGHVPTMSERHELKFLDEFGTVEDAAEAMRVTGMRQCTCTLLWGGEKVKNGKNGVTTSALWVCKLDVMQFATYLHRKQLGDSDDTPLGPLPGFNAEAACSSAMLGRGTYVDGAWFHGMMQAVGSDEISCGFIARKVHSVRDVCCVTDVVLDRRSETDKYDAVERMWKETWAPVYKRRTGALIKSAIRKWNKRESHRRRH
jgi:hypothetical protein